MAHEGIFGFRRKIASQRERRLLSPAAARGPGLARTLLIAGLVTALATALSYLLPPSWAATGVGFVFLIASYWLVIRTDDVPRIRGFGLSLGGLLEPEPIAGGRVMRAALGALVPALVCAAVIFPCFWLGFRLWWKVGDFHAAPLWPALTRLTEEILVIALPEEAFYRGYLQTSLERDLGRQVTIWGVRFGPGLVLTSVIFAVGHLLTELDPARLAVFFPSLVFGLLRARTGGIGASVLFHALCNVFSWYLLHSYGLVR